MSDLDLASMGLTLAAVDAAAARIAPFVRRTPTLRAEGPDGRELVFKLEGLQRSGSFKLRGALNKMMSLGESARAGVVTASGGNHGLGVACAASMLGVPARIFVPASAPRAKMEALTAATSQVELVQGRYPEADVAARAFAAAHGLAYVHAYDDADVIAGQGTVALELLADAPDVRTLVVSVGGGGLIAGSVLAAQDRRVVGVEPEGAATMHTALRAGVPTRLDAINSVASDSLGAGMAGVLTFAICQHGLDRVELLDDAAILEARRWLWTHLRVAVEVGAATGLAALMRGRLDHDPGPIGIILCGSNTDPATLGAGP